MHGMRRYMGGRLRGTLLAIGAALALGVLAAPASAATIGGQLFATGGPVRVTVLSASAGFTSQLFLRNPDGSRTPIAYNTEAGRTVELGTFPAGQELVFGIHVLNSGYDFLMGPGNRNPDGLAHAAVTEVGTRTFDVGFEDFINGGDRDYNDNMFRFTGELAPNRPPTADDQSVTVPEDGSRAITLTGSDPDGTPVAFAVASSASHGTLTGSGADRSYTPDANYHGPDSFTFTADDGSSTGTGTVSITVTPVNDAPGADDQSLTLPEDGSRAITLTGSDIDGDALTYGIASSPSHGTLTGSGADRTYTPDANYHGPDSFTFGVDDGNGGSDTATVAITVTPVNDAPVAGDDSAGTDENDAVTVPVLANDTDADGDVLIVDQLTSPAQGTASCGATTCTYRPVSNYAGPDSFSYQACDPTGACDTAVVTIAVRRVGKAGVLTGGAWTLADDGKTHHQVQLGCTAAEGGRLTVKGKSGTFELTRTDYALCIDAPNIGAGSPLAGWDTHRGSGAGMYNGAPGYTVEWTLTDAGEPGSADSAEIVVRNPAGAVVLAEHGLLSGGNHQAHGA
jgi:ribosomal protein S30